MAIIVVTDLIFYFGIYVPSEPRDLILAFNSLPEELWTMLVARMPMKSPTRGLLVLLMRPAAKSSPKARKAVPTRVILSRKT